VNPRKQGKFVAGSGQQIVAPDLLRDYQPDVVLVMNALYLNEISGMIAAFGVKATVESV